MPSPGFEPESSDREPEMIGRTTPQGHNSKKRDIVFKGCYELFQKLMC